MSEWDLSAPVSREHRARIHAATTNALKAWNDWKTDPTPSRKSDVLLAERATSRQLLVGESSGLKK